MRATNDAAFAFYSTLGYRELGRVPGYYQGIEPAIRMARAGVTVNEDLFDTLQMSARRLQRWSPKSAFFRPDGTPLELGDTLVQPYVTSVETYGERSLVFIDGELTHGVRLQESAS